jgi:hypothetical protein
MLTLLLASVFSAEAAQLQWSWVDAGPVTYKTQTFVQDQTGFRYLSVKNLDARARETAVSMTLTCTAAAKGKVTQVDCVIDDVALGGTAFVGEQDKLETIFQQHVDVLSGAHVVLAVAADGRIRSVDLEGVEAKTGRQNMVAEQLRQLMRRAVAPLGMQTPKGGEVSTRPWRHKGSQPAFFDLFHTLANDGAMYATSGGSRYTYKVEPNAADDRVAVDAEGLANVAGVVEREGGSGRIVNILGGGSYRWDATTGVLDYAELGFSGLYTASANIVGADAAYAYAAQVARVRPDGSIATLDAVAKP